MPENFFHYPDATIFHATPTDGYTFKEARELMDDQDKILKLRKRLTDYYINGLNSIPHSFMMAIMTCVGIEVLGQVLLGYNSKGESIEGNTILIYQMLDQKLTEPLTPKFKTSYATNRDIPINDINSFTSYAQILRKGLRNAFTHNYRSLGVFIGGNELVTIDEDGGYMIVNHIMFREQFVKCFEDCFEQIISNTNHTYRNNALNYFALLIK